MDHFYWFEFTDKFIRFNLLINLYFNMLARWLEHWDWSVLCVITDAAEESQDKHRVHAVKSAGFGSPCGGESILTCAFSYHGLQGSGEYSSVMEKTI